MANKKPTKAKSSPRKKTRVMPKWKKAPPELVDLFTNAMTAFPEAEMRKMFGYPCAFVNGNMATCLFADTIMLRLDASDREEFIGKTGAGLFEPVPGRVMKEYAAVPPKIRDNPRELTGWLTKSINFASSLPKKGKKKRAG